MKGDYKYISLDRITDPARPLRSDLSPESVAELTASICEIGIIEPLIVKKKGNLFEVIAGHRRLVAAGIAGLTEAPCVVVKAKGMQGEMIKLHENLNRDDISAIDWANHLAELKSHYQLSNAKIGKRLGMSEDWVTQRLAILQYDPQLKEALQQDQLSFSAARELSQISDPNKRKVYIGHAIRGGVTTSLAIRWRKEANREPLTMTPEESPEPPTGELVSREPQVPLCAVCGEEIPLGESVTLQVHTKCQPQASE